jgi:Divergent InlB B-repeat domain
LALATPARGQAPGTWQTLGPATNLNTSAVACGQPGAPPPPTCIPATLPGVAGARQNLINAWVDMAWDPTRKLLVSVAGGGHADWAGNQVVGFSVETLTWSILRTYSPNYPTGAGPYGPVYPDGTPASVHSYGCVEYMPSVDQFNRAGGIYHSPGGASSPQQTAWFNPNGAAWTLKVVRPGGYGCHMRLDPSSGKVLTRLANDVRLYDPATDTYPVLFTQTSPGTTTGGSSLAGPVNGRKYYRLRGVMSPRSIGMIDIDNPTAKEQTILTGGDTQVESTVGQMALIIGTRLVAYGPGPTAGTGAMYVMDLSQPCGLAGQPLCMWVRDVPPDGVYPPAPMPNGTWKRGVYYEPHNKIYIVHRGDTPVLTWTPSFTPPGPTPKTLTITPAGPGAGTTSGAGSYPEGTVVAVVQTPDVNSTAIGLSGDPDCSDGSVTMDADKTCVSTFGLKTRTLTLLTNGTGAGTVTGGGDYPHGSQAIIDATPASGSATGTITGAGCPSSPGPVVMDADKTCTVPFNDVQPPNVSITSPASGAYITQPGIVQIGFTITDNMPGGTTTCEIDGTPVTCGPWSVPADAPTGPRTITVRHVDAAGNSGQATIIVHVVLCSC